MDYNPLPDLAIFGAFLLTLGVIIWRGSRKPKPYQRYHMVDQKRRHAK